MTIGTTARLASLFGLVTSLVVIAPKVAEIDVTPPAASEASIIDTPRLGDLSIPGGGWPDWCLATAYIALESERHAAHAEYWNVVGKCANSDDPLYACIVQAQNERQDALDLADDRFDARVALCALLGPDRYIPDLDPNDFSANVTNSYFPLVPGRTLIYEGMTAEGLERIEVESRTATYDVDGITCREVRDLVRLDGVVIEDTRDWYAQHADGSVWYLGEIAQNYEDGELADLDGSWRTGEDGAQAGTIMLATPTVGTTYRQEFLLGEAEDVAKVVAVGQTVTVAAGTFTNCIVTEDWTPLEPGFVEHKTYAPGVGMVKEVNIGTGEVIELIQIQ